MEKSYISKSLKFWGLTVLTLVMVFMYKQFGPKEISPFLSFAFLAPLVGAFLCIALEPITLFITTVVAEGYLVTTGFLDSAGIDSWWTWIILIFAGLLALVCVVVTFVMRKPNQANKKWL